MIIVSLFNDNERYGSLPSFLFARVRGCMTRHTEEEFFGVTRWSVFLNYFITFWVGCTIVIGVILETEFFLCFQVIFSFDLFKASCF